jgi:hypothetical protein
MLRTSAELTLCRRSRQGHHRGATICHSALGQRHDIIVTGATGAPIGADVATATASCENMWPLH